MVATYQDASDQTSLSRIWGGIHPPIDDIRGRIIGKQIATETFIKVLTYFESTLTAESSMLEDSFPLYPNPLKEFMNIKTTKPSIYQLTLFSYDGKIVNKLISSLTDEATKLDVSNINSGFYLLEIKDIVSGNHISRKIIKN